MTRQIGYSDGFIIIKLLEIDFSKDILNRDYIFFKWFHKNIRIDLEFNKSKIILRQFSIINKKRIAEIPIENVTNRKQIFMVISWNRNSTIIYVPQNNPSILIANTENYNIHIDDNGNYTLNHPSIWYSQMILNDQNILNDVVIEHPNAIDTWINNLKEIYSLLEVRNIRNHIAKMEIYKTCLSRLVKGLEIYFKDRFVELGYYIIPNYIKIIKYYKKDIRFEVEKEIKNLKSIQNFNSFIINLDKFIISKIEEEFYFFK